MGGRLRVREGALAKDPAARFGERCRVRGRPAGIARGGRRDDARDCARSRPAPAAATRRRGRGWPSRLRRTAPRGGCARRDRRLRSSPATTSGTLPTTRLSVSVKTVTQPGTTIVTTAPPRDHGCAGDERPGGAQQQRLCVDCSRATTRPRCPCSRCRPAASAATPTSRPRTRTTTSGDAHQARPLRRGDAVPRGVTRASAAPARGEGRDQARAPLLRRPRHKNGDGG